MNKPKIGLFFGGRSFEHEVSLRSMKSIVKAIDYEKFEIVLVPVSKQGEVMIAPSMAIFDSALAVDESLGQCQRCGLDGISQLGLSCVFSTMHGGTGENGAFQGLFEILEIPCVGPGVLGSSIAMDKDVTKRLLQASGLSVVPFKTLKAHRIDHQILSSQGFPCFIKAASLGSSVGVYKCYNLEEAISAASQVFKLDNKLLVEKAIKGREIEVAVLGSENLTASIAGEIIPTHDFYSYEAKYLDEHGAILELPARNVNHELLKETAIKACDCLEITGMARVDFFVTEGGELYINEVNTLPGFTDISMYPKLFEISQVPYCELITRLITDAISRFEKSSQLQKTLYVNLID